MKSILKFSVALVFFSVQSRCLYAQNVVDSVVVDMSLDIKKGKPYGSHKVPVRGVAVPTVILYNTIGILTFIAEDDRTPAAYSIYDENGTSVMSGILLYDENGMYRVGVQPLAFGNYMLQLEVQNIFYVGAFSKKED